MVKGRYERVDHEQVWEEYAKGRLPADIGRRPKPAKLATRAGLRTVVDTRLRQRWSPQQIAGWLRRAYPDEPEWRVPHETIYRSLFVQARGALGQELTGYLRTRRVMRRPHGASTYGSTTMGQLRDVVSIRQRHHCRIAIELAL